MRTKTNKFLTVMLVVLSVVFMSLGVIIAKPATNYGASAQDTASVLVMDEGASIRVEDHQGLKFTAKISDADYEDLCTQYGAENVKFGMLIAPATFAELNEANVFGNEYAEPVFDWAEYDETTDNWAEYNGSKDQIINIYGQNVKATTDGYWAFSGSMSNLQLSSLISKFQGRAYIEIDLDAGAKHYIFADTNNNVVTPYAVAAKVAHASGAETGLNDDQQDWIKANYVNAIKNIGANASDLGLVKADTINLDNQALKAYPTSGAKLGLPAVDSLQSITLERYMIGGGLGTDGATYKSLYTIDTADILSNDWSLDISALADGLYKVTATVNGIASYEIYFEKYVENVFTWNNLTAEQDSKVVGIKLTNGWNSNIYKNGGITVSVVNSVLDREGTYYKVDGLTSSRRDVGVGIYPVHSKEYYQMFYTEDTDPILLVDLGITNSADGSISTAKIQSYEYYGYTSTFGISSGKIDKYPVNGWASAQRISFKALIENFWDEFSTHGNKGTFFGGWDSIPFATTAVYVGNFRLTDVAYTQEHYFETGVGTGVFEKREANPDEVLTADFGATVEFVPATEIGNFAYDASNVNAVLSGVNNGSLVLKGFYKANKTTVSNTLTGLQTASTHALSSLTGELENVTVYQYVVKGGGESKLALSDATTTAYAIDATAAYASNVKSDNGIYIDTAGLDGIFKFVVESTSGREELIFEQVTDNFVWNNLTADPSNIGLKAVGVSDTTKSFVTTALDRTGSYYRVDGITSSNRVYVGLGVYPVHTKAYYQSFYNDETTPYLTYDIGASKSGDETQVAHRPEFGYGNDRAGQFYNLSFGYSADTSSSLNCMYYKNGWASSTVKAPLNTMIETYWGNFIANDDKYPGTFWGTLKGVPGDLGTAVIYIGNIRLTKADYAVKHYFETEVGSGEFVENADLAASSVVNANFGATVEYAPVTVEGYTYREDNANAVASGVNNGKLVLKGYYTKNKETKFTTLTGIQSGATIPLSISGDFTEIIVKQYVVKASGDVTLTLSEGVNTKVKGVDVTELYAANVKSDNGIYIDTTGLDGIFTFAVETATGREEITFEQETVGVFNWNTLADVESVYVSGRYDSASYPPPSYDLTIVQQADMATELAGTGLTTSHKHYNPNSWYAKVVVTSTITSGIGFNIYPGHTKAYYEAWVTVQDANFDMPLATESSAGANTARAFGYFSSDANNIYWRDNGAGGDSWGSTSGWAAKKTTTLSTFLTDTNWKICTGATKLGQWMTKQYPELATWYVGCPFFVA